MARKERRTFGSSFTGQTAKVVGTAIAGKIVLWGIALLVLKKFASASAGTAGAKAADVALKVAAPPQFLVSAVSPFDGGPAAG